MSVDIQTCYRHPDRKAGVTCQRCDRPICPACMKQASVGFHCPECAKGGRQQVFTARTLGQVNQPIVTKVLIGINVAVFVVLNRTGRVGSNGPASLTDFDLYGPQVANGEWYRLVTSGFLHANLIHIAMNMFALWILGSQLEPAVGRAKFAAVYFTALLTGSLGVMLVSPNDATVGASGAIFGIMGFVLASQVARRINIWQSGVGTLVVINLLFTLAVPGISIGGHVGGLVGGFLCGVILEHLGPRLGSKALPIALCSVLGAAAFATALVIA